MSEWYSIKTRVDTVYLKKFIWSTIVSNFSLLDRTMVLRDACSAVARRPTITLPPPPPLAALAVSEHRCIGLDSIDFYSVPLELGYNRLINTI